MGRICVLCKLKPCVLKKKYKIILNWIIGPILFAWLSVSIYKQVTEQQNLPQAWQAIKASFNTGEKWYLLSVVLLMFVNWGLEARKWQFLVRNIQQLSFWRAYKAIFTGQAVALNTVNSVGEYVGRVMYLEEGNRLRSVAVSLVGSFSQIIVTMVLGIAGLVFLNLGFIDATHHLQGVSVFWLKGLLYLLSFGTVVLILIYFNLSWLTLLAEKIPFVARYRYLVEQLENFHNKELTRILLLSFIRYIVFVVQYLLLLRFFHVQANVMQLAWMVCIYFLVLAVVPTIPVAELGLRGEAGKQLFGLLSTNTLGILFTAAFIWFINRAVPAVAGSLFILGVKLFKK